MKMLLKSYENDPVAIGEIIEARKALIDYYITTLRYACMTDEKEMEKEISLDAYDAAREAVKTLNFMCMKKGVDPIYTGSFTRSHELFCFAERLVMGILTETASKN